MRSIVILIHEIGSGGVTSAVIEQANMFTAAGIDTTIVTLNDDPWWSDKVADLRTSGRLSSEARVLNVYGDSRDRASVEAGTPAAEHAGTSTFGSWLRGHTHAQAEPAGETGVDGPEDDFVESGSDKHGAYRRHFAANGDYLSFDRLADDGSIHHINYFRNRVFVRRDDYHAGELCRRTHYTPDEKVKLVQFMTADGFCYAQRWVDPETQRGEGVFITDRRKGKMKRLNGLPDWHVAWLQQVIDGYSTPPIVIAETASVIPKMLRLRRKSAVRMAMMHNSHLAAPFRVDSPLRPDYEATFSRLEGLDAFVILTEQQRRDMEERLHAHGMFTVVPNVLRMAEPGRTTRNPHLVSVVSRLAPQKALHEAIEAFEMVLAEEPEARLEIYGRGPSTGALKKLIVERGLGDSVILKGRTSQPAEAMARSLCTVSTSDWEALPFSIAESLAVGTPVVAYDCLYGPRALIENEKTGFIVHRGDKAGLAARIVRLLRDPELAEKLGQAGRLDVEARLTAPAVMERWRAAFALAEKRSGLRTPTA